MNARKENNKRLARRTARTRAKLHGTAERPRLAVFRSNRSLYVQLIDDDAHRTLAAASTRELPGADKAQLRVAQGLAVGTLVAGRAKEQGITTVVFDRRLYRFHGRVKAVADGARAAGLLF